MDEDSDDDEEFQIAEEEVLQYNTAIAIARAENAIVGAMYCV